MNALRRFVSDWPLTVFVVAAYALSWWSIPFAAGRILPHGPLFAAVFVLGLSRGREGLGEWVRRATSWRGGWRWLFIGPGLVLVWLWVALALNLLLGATLAGTAHLSRAAGAVPVLLLLGGQWEEPGWTAYALPLLLRRHASRPFGPLIASLILGGIRAGWHLPLMLSGAIPWFDLVFFSMAFQLLITWLFNRTSGNVLVVMLFHWTSNVVGGVLMAPLFTGADHVRYYALSIAVACLLAVVLAGRRRWSMGCPSTGR